MSKSHESGRLLLKSGRVLLSCGWPGQAVEPERLETLRVRRASPHRPGLQKWTAASRGGTFPGAAAWGVLASLALAACGSGERSITGTRPAITVSVAPTTAVVQAGAAIRLTGAVSNDPSNRGVTWMVSCSAAQCGTLSPTATASGSPATYTAPPTLPANGATITIMATSVADAGQSASATLIPVGHIPGYDVGVDYHDYGTDLLHTAFITIYHQAAVRQTVRAQLQGMADRGATFIHTMIWPTTEPGTTDFGETYRATFPLTDQEAANLRAYAQDVAAIRGAGGNRLLLDIAFGWLGAADYTRGSPATGLGWFNLSAAEFSARLATTTDKVLAAVSDVTRPDGLRLVNRIFFDTEILIPAPGEPNGKPNEGWLLTANYPRFVSVVSAKGIQPAVYFDAGGEQREALDNSYIDAVYPILNGHRSMFWIYRSLKFMVDHGLLIPDRIDFSCYLVSTGASYDQLLQRVLDDADATLPSLGAPRLYGAAETFYPPDSGQRALYGRAFATQAAQNARLQRVSFWPESGVPGVLVAYPFAIEAFLPPPAP